ncbi:MAG: stage 0 sporulation family protein [Firmicutes bacterium]|nr:stage 0 sporulation family protein [Bacillota bacterium]
MYKVVGVRFKKAGKIYYFDPGDIELALGDGVIVETARGIEFGYLVVGPKMVSEEEIVTPLKKVIRKADESDFKKVEENEQKAKEAFRIGLEKIAKHGLPMKLVNVEYTFDTKKIIFYFTAEGRVDFRELVKDLASVFRTRIELRQIGVRDEAKMVGGLGLCGRPICCHTFLGEFEPVSIRMAKDQNLSLNPTKISGLCGRLMCCLQFEADTYKDALEQLPSVGDLIETPQGQGKVTEVNPLTGEVHVEVAEGVEVVLNLGDDAAKCDGCDHCCSVRHQVTAANCPLAQELEEEPLLVVQEEPSPAEPETTQPNAEVEKEGAKPKRNRRKRKAKGGQNKKAAGQPAQEGSAAPDEVSKSKHNKQGKKRRRPKKRQPAAEKEPTTD